MSTDADAVWAGVEELLQGFGRWSVQHPDASIEQIQRVARDVFGLDVTAPEGSSVAGVQGQEIAITRKLGNIRIVGVTFASGHVVAARIP